MLQIIVKGLITINVTIKVNYIYIYITFKTYL